MNYTKENIFPMYVGKCKVRHTKKYTDDYGKPFPITCDYEFQAFYPNNDRTNEKVVAGHKGQTARINISDCTLLLIPISKMSKEEKNKWGLLRLHPEVRGYGRVAYDTPESFLWLIQHGYAISDQLFELGIAEEKGEFNKMNLTGKCLTDFEEWFDAKKYELFAYYGGTGSDLFVDLYADKFKYIPETMQQGVLLAFFRDKGIDIEITKWEDQQREMDNIRTNKYYWIIYVDNEFKSLDCECKTYEMQHNYTTAFNEAINKAVEIYNGKEL